MIEGSKVYIDPAFTKFCSDLLDILPLIVDRIIIYNPTNRNLRLWKYPEDRFYRLVDEKLIVPLFMEPVYDTNLENDKYLTRNELLDDYEFWYEYEKLIEEDLEDEEFKKVVQRIYRKNYDSKLFDITFSNNWNIIIMQIIESPIIMDSRFKPLLFYKFSKTLHDITNIIEIPPTVLKHTTLKRFLYCVLERLPRDLTVEEIISFRESKGAIRFRKWLEEEIIKALKAKKLIPSIRPYEEILRDFKELIDEYNKRIDTTAHVLSITLSGIVGMIGGPIGGFLTAASSLAGLLIFPKLLKKLWERFSPNNWIFLLLSMKKNVV